MVKFLWWNGIIFQLKFSLVVCGMWPKTVIYTVGVCIIRRDIMVTIVLTSNFIFSFPGKRKINLLINFRKVFFWSIIAHCITTKIIICFFLILIYILVPRGSILNVGHICNRHLLNKLPVCIALLSMLAGKIFITLNWA